MAELRLTDLDADPQLLSEVLELLRGCPPGRDHAVSGHPSRMGCEPRPQDLHDALGVLVATADGETAGALAICPYSDEQVTLWGPVVHRRLVRRGIGSRLLHEARAALREGGYESLRVLVDTRNRDARAFFLASGLAVWKDDLLYERNLLGALPPSPGGVSRARPSDHAEVAGVFAAAFPESGHLQRPLAQREREGYRHHILQDSGRILAAAAVKGEPERSWLSLLAVRPEARGRHLGTRLLAGALHAEAELGVTRLGLEVLADNVPAIALYTGLGFQRAWTATIMTGPV